MIIGKCNMLDEKYVPGLTNYGDVNVGVSIIRPLVKMIDAAKRQGVDMKVVSGYRSYDRQRMLYLNSMMKKGIEHANLYVAPAGASEHQSGLAVDISCKEVGFELEEEFEKTSAGKWLYENSFRYGFILRYPKGMERITGFAYEPWHFRYVGRDVAFAMRRRNIHTLEEWMALSSKK